MRLKTDLVKRRRSCRGPKKGERSDDELGKSRIFLAALIHSGLSDPVRVEALEKTFTFSYFFIGLEFAGVARELPLLAGPKHTADLSDRLHSSGRCNGPAPVNEQPRRTECGRY